MASAAQKEILGDWSNLKGTRYHLVYGLWLVLRGGVESFAFYEGNDLHATPVRPPNQDDPGDGPLVVPVAAVRGGTDIWVRLKATPDPWTVSELLADNLLFNFLCNAVRSRQEGRAWEVRLVTEGVIRKTEIEEFTKNPIAKRDNNKKLEGIITRTHATLSKVGGTPPESELRERALEILSQIAATSPVAFETLKAQVELSLAYACPHPPAVARLASLLVGALLVDSSDRPTVARRYDSRWLNEQAGWAVISDRPFDRDPLVGCDVATQAGVNRSLNRPFVPERHVARGELDAALARFLAAPQPLFVLLGRSGIGKTSALADWALHTLHGKVRLFARATDLAVERTESLSRLATDCLTPYTARNWNEGDLFRRLADIGAVPGVGPAVIVIDDVQPTTATAEAWRHRLARLAHEARENGIKLVVSSPTELWEMFRLYTTLPLECVYSDSNAPVPVPSSFTLGEFNTEEFTAALGLRFLSNEVARVARFLGGPGFAPLRTPYLLERYLEQQGECLARTDEPPDPVDTNGLLDHHAARLIEAAATRPVVDIAAATAGFEALVGLLWAHRPAGVSVAAATIALREHAPGQEPDLLREFRRVGLLTVELPINITDPTLAGRLFARRLLLSPDQAAWESTLSPDIDSHVVEALFRTVEDGADFAERLLRRNPGWAPAVSLGLSQRSPDDVASLAVVACMTRPEPNHLVGQDGCRALGVLASRGGRALARVEAMFMGDDDLDQLRGAAAFTTAMAYVPDVVGELVRQRLSRVPDGNDRHEYLASTLDALVQIDDPGAAMVVREIVEGFPQLFDPDAGPVAARVVARLDFIRGEVAAYLPAEQERILAGLRADEVSVRLRAAASLHSLLFSQAGRFLGETCEAIRTETNSHVLLRLLWASFPLIEADADALLDAIAASAVCNWNDPVYAGHALVVLGVAARRRPQAAHALLPRDLGRLPGWARACLWDVFALAWWQCADQVPEARQQLERLAEVSLRGIPSTFQTFAYRGAFIAGLGCVLAGLGLAGDITVSATGHDGANIPYLFADLRDFYCDHTNLLTASPLFPRLIESLQACVRTGATRTFEQGLAHRDLSNARYWCSGRSLDDLLHLSLTQDDALCFVREVPRDWQAIYAARGLLERGRTDQGVVDFAQAACAEHDRGGSMTALAERNQCLGRLALLNPSPDLAIAHHAGQLGPSIFGLAGGGPAQGLANLADANPDRVLHLLDVAVSDDDRIPLLLDWARQTRTWRAFLIAEVYARMFRPRPIDRAEATSLVDQMLIAVRSLPAHPLREEYAAVYGAINTRLSGGLVALPPFPPPTSPIGRSHAIGLELLGLSSAADIQAAVLDRRCWWDTQHYELREGRLTVGSGLYLLYALPAVRLAAVASGVVAGISDPIACLTTLRERAADACGNASVALHRPQEVPERLELHLATLNGLLAGMPSDERLLNNVGVLLLTLRRPAEAEAVLERSLRSPCRSVESQANAHYNLACVAAVTGRIEDCRSRLVQAIELRPTPRDQLAADPDFASVRDLDWFRGLLTSASPPG